MKYRTIKACVNGSIVGLELQFWEESDRERLRTLFKFWSDLNSGMKEIASRGINLPEGISESAFCLDFDKNAGRALKGGSFDAYDASTGRAIQIKASSVEYDLTSFGPKSYWNDLYFLDFYNGGSIDGSFDVYLIPNEKVFNARLNSGQTFRDQQAQKRRPRFGIKKEIIEPLSLKPVKKCRI
jgi:hypothetical protein